MAVTPALPLDRHVRRGQDDYFVALEQLLPYGIAWPRDPTTVLMSIVYGFAGILGYVDGRAADLLERESDPRITVELLPDWERNWGLPDPCYGEPITIADRQKALVQRMTILGAQSREFFIETAAFLGYTVTISEFRPFMVGIDRCGDNRTLLPSGSLSEKPNYGIGDPAMRFYWLVHVFRVRLTWFRCARSQTGVDPHLRIARATDLECLFHRWAPAQTEPLFDYSGVLPPDPMAGTP